MFGTTDQLAINNNRIFSAIPPVRAQSYLSDIELDLYLAHAVLEHPPRPSAAILKLQDPALKCDKNLEWNIDWAVAFIIEHLATTKAADALRAIRKRAADLESAGLLQDIPYRIFNKLDEVLFAGHLRNAVYLGISNLGLDISGTTFTHGWGPDREIKRISIIINSNTLEYGKARDIVAALIHHMIHAYFLVACGPQIEDEVPYGRLGHDVHFGKILLAIKKLSATHGEELTALKFSYRSLRPRYFADDIYAPYNRFFAGRKEGEVCEPMFDQHASVRSTEVYIYNDRRNELALEHRARLLPSAKSVEFIFNDKFVQVESKKIDDLVKIRKAFERVESRYLKIDKSASEATFLPFLEFVHMQSYRPDTTPFAALSAGFGMGRRGPPIIKPGSSSTDAPLLADVEFTRFASLMEFDECRQYALGRMNAYGITYEDPVTILRAIYHGHEPDPELKAWTRKFLVHAPITVLSGYDLHTTEPPNLLKLEQESGLYRARFLDAMDCSGALENDVNKARAELKALGWYNWTPLLHSSTEFLVAAPSRTYPHATLTLGRARSPPPLTDGCMSPLHALSSLHSSLLSLSTTDIERLREYERLLELEKSRERERSEAKEKSRDLELMRLQVLELERDADRTWEREKKKTRESREREREAHAQTYTMAYLEKFFGRKKGGFVEDDSDG
ncbi:hypothetical protein T440DRAFT_528720 [Plenodomus tracheiphilus IPT5]|uniref:Uncharacterized protein n=1 Tax=Plenodomus tracheiphilus IPT5 TaxID=1408161 RepID=A0A6A7B7M9_9PLEO|nr:hypothetical protein T440DRAFT_528720 [Plenodomus tracheiphilus IPT5]